MKTVANSDLIMRKISVDLMWKVYRYMVKLEMSQLLSSRWVETGDGGGGRTYSKMDRTKK